MPATPYAALYFIGFRFGGALASAQTWANSQGKPIQSHRPPHGFATRGAGTVTGFASRRLMISWVVPVSQLGEYSRDAVDVRIRARVRHGVNGKSDIEPARMRLACGRLDTDASGDAGDYDLRAPSLFRYSSRPVFVNAPHVRFVTAWSSDCPFSLGTRSAHPAGSSPRLRVCSVRPGVSPPTLTSTTGRPRWRNTSASALARSTTSSIRCAVGRRQCLSADR